MTHAVTAAEVEKEVLAVMLSYAPDQFTSENVPVRQAMLMGIIRGLYLSIAHLNEWKHNEMLADIQHATLYMAQRAGRDVEKRV